MGKTAVVFPGQGSQFVGMGKDFYDNYDAVKQIYNKADEVLGFKLSDIMFDGPEDDLKLTFNTQPALLTMSTALWAVVQDRFQADYFAGHSLGEYSALVAAGGLTFEEAVLAVHNRGKFMQQAVPVGVGAMAAVMGLDEEGVISACTKVSREGHVCEPANFNCPGQIVVAGHDAAVDDFEKAAKELGAKRVVKLPVSAPFHCSLMMPAQIKMAEYLKNNVVIKDLQTPVFNNVEAVIEKEAAVVEDALVRQVSSSVLWTKTIAGMIAEGVDTFVEVGAGKVLTGLIKKIDKTVKCVNISTLDDLNS